MSFTCLLEMRPLLKVLFFIEEYRLKTCIKNSNVRLHAWRMGQLCEWRDENVQALKSY